jgi:iron complex transport system substrate-binding protein
MRRTEYSFPIRRPCEKCHIERRMRIATLGEMLEDVIRLGEETGAEEHAHELRGELEGRLAAVGATVSGASLPRVIALERFNPPHVAGRWVPEMISIAGGEDVAGPPGLRSSEVGWGELAGLNPDVVIAMPDGANVDEARAQAMEHWERIEDLGAGRIFAVDAASTLSSPGPQLIDGVELLGHLLHPELVDPPGSTDFVELRAPVARPGPF